MKFYGYGDKYIIASARGLQQGECWHGEAGRPDAGRARSICVWRGKYQHGLRNGCCRKHYRCRRTATLFRGGKLNGATGKHEY
jgi:hypothetical protein